MTRPLRIEFPGGVYHITSRGNGQQEIFLTEADRELFLDLLGQAIDRFQWLCHAYCLMANHYHLLIETPEANLSRGMRHLNGVYTQRFNRQHQRGGHVFQGRYKAIVVQKDSHLLALCRYVVLNPGRGIRGRSCIKIFERISKTLSGLTRPSHRSLSVGLPRLLFDVEPLSPAD